jgi:TRAP-type C4-dicarboxylate transport system permease small subunit
MNRPRTAAALIGNIPEVVAGLLIATITVILFVGVVWRYFLVDPLTWSDEIARALFVWLTFIGAAVAVKRGLHSAVSLLGPTAFGKAHRRIMAFIGQFAIGVMGVALVVIGATQTAANFKQMMPVTGIPYGWLYLAVPVSGLLMLIYLVPQIRNTALGIPLASSHGHVE